MKAIVVGVDGSAASIAALRWAADEARMRGDDVRVLHAWARPMAHSALDTVSPIELGFDFEAAATESLQRSIAEAGLDGSTVTVRPEIVHAGAAEALVRASAGADLLVVGSRGRGGFTGLLLGSVSRQCAHHSKCPVVIFRPPAAAHPAGKIVVGIDGSECANAAVEWAAREAELRNARLHLIHSWTYPPVSVPLSALEDLPAVDIEGAARAVLAEPVERLTSQGLEADGEVRNELPAQALIEASKGADLLVVGARGLGGFKGLLLGSVSDQCAHHAHCPVVIVRQ